MKKNIFIFSALILMVTLSCNNSDNKNPSQDNSKPKTKADSLLDDVMAGHDVSMAKMNKLSVLKSKIQHSIDSISALPEKAKKASEAFKSSLDSSLAELQSANGRMNKWMDEFNMDSAENNMDERIKYLESEKMKVTSVRDDMISSIGKADSLLKKTIRQ